MLRERYRFDEDNQSTTSEDRASLRDVDRGSSDTPSDSQYMNPIRQTPLSPNNEQALEFDVDTPLPQPQQKPNNLLGEVYFNHQLSMYHTLRHKETLDPQSVIYHVQQDKCFYFSTEQTWKPAPVVDFPAGTKFYWYRSGPLKIPNWPVMRYSILTPLPPDSQPESPLLSAFRPIQPLDSEIIEIPVSRPKPIQLKTFKHPERKEQQPVTHPPRSFSHAQQMEIDRQVALRLQEMEIARLHEKEPNSQRPDNRFAMRRNSAQTRTEYGPTYPKEYGLAVPTYGQPGESASVESKSQHQRRQHLPYHQQTPVSRKTKKGQQIQRHTIRQTQHDWDAHTPANAVQDQRIKQHQWDPHTPAYVPQRYDSGQRRGYNSRQNYFDQRNPARQNQQNNYDYHNQWQFGKHWTSTPRDPNSKYNSSNVPGVSGDTTMNNSLLNILDTQCKVQQETTQALSSII